MGPIARKNHHAVRMCDQKETPCFLVYRKQGGIAIGRGGARYTTTLTLMAFFLKPDPIGLLVPNLLKF